MGSPYLEMTLLVIAFGIWSSLWPRQALKRRLEPLVGFKAYRIFYNVGTIGLLVWSMAYLMYRSAETPVLWDLRAYAWFKPLVYLVNALGIFFGASLVQHGLTFWGFKTPPKVLALHTSGFYKITRHPLYWSVFFLFLGHTLVMGTALSVLFFFLMELYNVIGVLAFENRSLKRQFGADFETFKTTTSTVPFVSLVLGRVKFQSGELPLRWVVNSILFTLAMNIFHDDLFVHSFLSWRPLLDFGFGL